MPASWPAAVGSTGISPRWRSAFVRRARGPSGNSTIGVSDSVVTSRVTESVAACRCASAVILSTSAVRVASSAALASSQARISRRYGVGPVGRDDHLAERRDRVVRGRLGPRRVHRRRECQHGVATIDQSRRSGVVGFATERELPPPVWPDRRTRPRRERSPSRAHAPARRATRRTPRRGSASCGSSPRCSGLRPARTSASANVIPSASRSPRARSAVRAPVDSCDPTHATPKRAPSSSENATTATGMAGTTPRSRSMSIAANADTTPSGPSNAPPSGTESRWEPVTKASRGSPVHPGGIHHAHMLPLRSTSTSIPRCSAHPTNHSRKVRSASDHANRR